MPAFLVFQATDEQVAQMAANACNAAKPMGLGHTSYNPGHRWDASCFRIVGGYLKVDYAMGRMVKLFVQKKHGAWRVTDDVDPQYQSWYDTYRTMRALLLSVGIDEKSIKRIE